MSAILFDVSRAGFYCGRWAVETAALIVGGKSCTRPNSRFGVAPRLLASGWRLGIDLIRTID
jgi:hypothetical protein